MQAHPAEYYTLPINLFPPAAVAMAYAAAHIAAVVTVAVTQRDSQSAAEDMKVPSFSEAPLLRHAADS